MSNDDDDIVKLILKKNSLIFSAMVFFPEKIVLKHVVLVEAFAYNIVTFWNIKNTF